MREWVCGSMTMFARSWRVQRSHLFLTTSVSLLLSDVALQCSPPRLLREHLLYTPPHRQSAIKHENALGVGSEARRAIGEI
jgi:hypothetical protein